MFTVQEAEARPPTALSFTATPVLLPGLACLTTSQGFLGPLLPTDHSYPWIWGSGLVSSIKLHLGLGVVPLSTAQMLRPLGSCWVTIGHGVLDGSVLLFFRPLYCFLVLMEAPWGLPKKDQCLGKSKACTALPIAGFFSGHKDGVLDIGALRDPSHWGVRLWHGVALSPNQAGGV